MLLCDIGNTSYHFLDSNTSYKKDVKTFDPATLKQIIYYICVNPHLKNRLQNLDNWVDLSWHVRRDNYYESMGVDRMMACEAVHNGVIIDAGSAITVDVICDGVFDGGFIYPGIAAMAETYKNISSALSYEFNFSLNLEELPKNSKDAISYGYLKLLFNEVNSYNKDLILTGGDAKKLINIFPHAKIDEELVFNGMKKVIQMLK